MTHYERLGVARDADTAAIRKAYRKLALKCHPDVCKDKDAEERFKQLGEAHDVLTDSNKRYFYDMALNPLPSVYVSNPDSLFTVSDPIIRTTTVSMNADGTVTVTVVDEAC